MNKKQIWRQIKVLEKAGIFHPIKDKQGKLTVPGPEIEYFFCKYIQVTIFARLFENLKNGCELVNNAARNGEIKSIKPGGHRFIEAVSAIKYLIKNGFTVHKINLLKKAKENSIPKVKVNVRKIETEKKEGRGNQSETPPLQGGQHLGDDIVGFTSNRYSRLVELSSGPARGEASEKGKENENEQECQDI